MMTDSLQHIAIIMDGNRRWAKQHNLPTIMGHREGAEAARRTLIACLKLKIPYLTLYTFSSENRNRNPEEVSELITLLKFYLSNELDLLIEQKIRVKFIGDKTNLTKEILSLMEHCEKETQNNSRLFLQIAFNYGAREEIVSAQKKLFSDLICDKLKLEELNEELFERYLYTASIPDPDLLIRTSGECRISNFLLWQLAYTELYFTKTLWPDFNITCLRRAIKNYNKRERRYGLSK